MAVELEYAIFVFGLKFGGDGLMVGDAFGIGTFYDPYDLVRNSQHFLLYYLEVFYDVYFGIGCSWIYCSEQLLLRC